MAADKDAYIQQLLENNEQPDNTMDPDVVAYRQLFAALQQPPADGFSFAFTAAITRRIIANNDKKFLRLTYGLLFLAAGIGIGFIFLFMDAEAFRTIGGALLSYKWIGLFIILLVAAMQWPFFTKKRIPVS
ncbi:MAG: hypothetical protein QM687_07305 [Ferruginibacter sp.]